MKKISFLFLILLIVLPLQAITKEEILDNYTRSLAVESVRGDFQVQLISKNGDVRRIEAQVYQRKADNGESNRLFLFDFPPTVRGTGLLIHSYTDGRPNNMWIYLPSIKRIKRISLESSGGGYFMGSDFTYQDLITNDLTDMEVEMLPDAVSDGIDCYVLKLRGRTEEIRRNDGYSYWISYHRKDNFMLYRREFFDFNGDLLKIYLTEEFYDFSPVIYPTKVTMTNVQTGHKSIIEVVEPTFESIPERYFTTRYLQNN